MIRNLTHRLVWLVAAWVFAVATPAAAQSRIAILDGTGVSVLDTATGQARARFELQLQAQETPFAISSSPDGARLFITTRTVSAESFLHVLDVSTGDRVARISASWLTGKAVVTPDGSRAFLTAGKVNNPTLGTTITTVDLTTMTAQVTALSSLEACTQGHSLTMHPNGEMLYMACRPLRSSGVLLREGRTVSLRITPTGLQENGALQSLDTLEPVALSVSPDGSRVHSTWSFGPAPVLTVKVHDGTTRAQVSSYAVGRLLEPVRVSGIGTITSQSASRAFVQMPPDSGTSFYVVLIDTTTGGLLAYTPINGTLVTDRTGTVTLALQADRVFRLDNDTVTPTPIATGSGGWRAVDVLPDPCPTDATASPAVFTTTGGTGTFTITAAPGCTWSIDASAVPGLTVTTSSGTGPASVPFSLGSTASARRGVVRIGARSVAIEQLQPLINIDEPGAVAQQPFIVRGWAIELSATPSTVAPAPATVSSVHVWAWPTTGGAPHFIGIANASGPRPDIAGVFGSAYGAAQFSLPVQGLPSGTYAIVAYAQSARIGTFTQEKGVLVTVQPGTRVAIEAPSTGVPRNFLVSGWAVDLSAATGPGVDAVHVWAYPSSGAGAIWVGAATYGGARPDIAALYGPSFGPSGYSLYASLPPGSYTLVVFARSTVTGEFNATTSALTVLPGSFADMNIDEPAPSATITGSFQVRGWAVDRGADSGSGVDAFHIWAFPVAGGDARFAGIGSPVARPDIEALFGPQFANAGFLLSGATLPAGTYDLVVYAHSSVTGTFNNYRVVRITVQ